MRAIVYILFSFSLFNTIFAQSLIPAELDSTKTESDKIPIKTETSQIPLFINTNSEKSETKNSRILNGYYILYNKNHQKTKDGIFKDNRLNDGKNYIYNANGILIRIEEYKDFSYKGDLPLDKK